MFQPAEILVLAGTTGAGGMAPPASARISAWMKCVQGHSSRVNMLAALLGLQGTFEADGGDTLAGAFQVAVILYP